MIMKLTQYLKGENNMQLEVLDINNKKYMVLNELTDDNETYVYLSNIKNPKDFVVRKVVGGLFKVVKKPYTDAVHEGLMQFVKFGIVGVSNTVLAYVLYAVTLLGIQKAGILPKVDYLVAQVIAFVLSVLWSFYWNNKMINIINSYIII